MVFLSLSTQVLIWGSAILILGVWLSKVVIFFLFYTNFFWNKTGAGNHVFSQLPASLNVLASK